MTDYAVVVGEREYKVEVRESNLFVDGVPLDFELTSLNGNGLHLFRRGDRNTEMYFKTVCGSDGAARVWGTTADTSYEVHVQGQTIVAKVDPLHAHRSRRRDAGRRGVTCQGGAEVDTGAVTAPMPGLIVELLVTAGQTVQSGDVLLTQESMKMQMQLRAPFSGRVEEVKVITGAQVEKGALLVRLTADETSG
jgi:biotin carboxyl carrier protein